MERRNSQYRTDWLWSNELREAYRELILNDIWSQLELARAAINNKRSGPI